MAEQRAEKGVVAEKDNVEDVKKRQRLAPVGAFSPLVWRWSKAVKASVGVTLAAGRAHAAKSSLALLEFTQKMYDSFGN